MTTTVTPSRMEITAARDLRPGTIATWDSCGRDGWGTVISVEIDDTGDTPMALIRWDRPRMPVEMVLAECRFLVDRWSIR